MLNKLFIVLSLLMLVGCSSSSGFFESIVPPGARQNYEASGANTLHFRDINALLPTTVNATVGITTVTHSLSQGCNMTWDVQVIDPIDYTFWLTQNIIITYDASLFSCGASFRCMYNGITASAVQTGLTWDVPVICEQIP